MSTVADGCGWLHNASNWKESNVAAFHATQFSAASNDDEIARVEPGCLQAPGFWCNNPGAFANVSINHKTRKITMIRDQFGVEPLYYYHDKKTFIFGSSLPDIIKSLGRTPPLNMNTVIALLARRQRYSHETFYQNIYSVEPGSITTIDAQGNTRKKLFWQLDPRADDIILPNDKAYLDRFSELMHESVAFNTHDCRDQVCGELSGGLDSSAILATSAAQGLSYPLFMHTATPGSTLVDDSDLAKLLLKRLKHDQASFINADQFDLIQELQYCAKQFAGAAPYILFTFSQTTNRAVAASGKRVLLSGAGGDQCVSNHAFNTPFFRSLCRQQGYRAAWRALSKEHQKTPNAPALLKRAGELIRLSHPRAYEFLRPYMSLKRLARKFLKTQSANNGYSALFGKHTLREMEWDLLQGPESHPLRMRMEYCSVLAKSMGFEYRYPLLYPKLVEFCFHLPLAQKRRHGTGRYLIREYLKRAGVPEAICQKQQKAGGIVPGSLDKGYRGLETGKFDAHFVDLPFTKYADQSTQHTELASKTYMYMLKYYAEQARTVTKPLSTIV